MLNGEYGIRDLYIGVPVKLGKNGIEEVIELNLNEREYKLLHESANHVRGLVKVLDDLNIFGD
jgi:malate dehydrogenase